jgi:hypothetical protein
MRKRIYVSKVSSIGGSRTINTEASLLLNAHANLALEKSMLKGG